MAWQQLAVFTRHPEFAEELLLAHGAASVTHEDAADEPVLEPAPGATPLWRSTRTRAMFALDVDLSPVVAALRAVLPEGQALRVEAGRLEDREWVRVWLEDWKPLRFGEHLWVTPEEKRTEIDDPQAVVVTLDPGLAFGTGTHASTALCLEWLAGHRITGCRVLDYGCGSGVLAVAALKLGASNATGVDIDPQALQATEDNARVNGVADRLRVAAAHAFATESFDVVVANILAQPLIELAPRLARCLRPGGHLILAGLLQRQADEVQRAYAPYFTFSGGAERDGWRRLDACRREE